MYIIYLYIYIIYCIYYNFSSLECGHDANEEAAL